MAASHGGGGGGGGGSLCATPDRLPVPPSRCSRPPRETKLRPAPPGPAGQSARGTVTFPRLRAPQVGGRRDRRATEPTNQSGERAEGAGPEYPPIQRELPWPAGRSGSAPRRPTSPWQPKEAGAGPFHRGGGARSFGSTPMESGPGHSAVAKALDSQACGPEFNPRQHMDPVMSGSFSLFLS
ncbi:actin nucleation-promoting factor WAS-like isoform X1 [Erinaceus europaeus]|uniref:Actin nucleation-promoting factor WAS-like isoform X1 n=1 Tax=Erinaceus europaeus TaxID=9365 RepID=A0ABM3WP91_ERIEU|nr:actin nucleation-promoting factor WAS-like isoform X1 [Erinaceus europaeus]